MKTHTQTDIWIYRIAIVLDLFAATGAIGAIALTILDWSTPELLLALGAVAVAGLLRLLVSPLNRWS
jgi:hypothetical protein